MHWWQNLTRYIHLVNTVLTPGSDTNQRPQPLGPLTRQATTFLWHHFRSRVDNRGQS
jgi:hypothetical protein